MATAANEVFTPYLTTRYAPGLDDGAPWAVVEQISVNSYKVLEHCLTEQEAEKRCLAHRCAAGDATALLELIALTFDVQDVNEAVIDVLATDYSEAPILERHKNSQALIDAAVSGDQAELGRLFFRMIGAYALQKAGK